jgi:hypothetical protein
MKKVLICLSVLGIVTLTAVTAFSKKEDKMIERVNDVLEGDVEILKDPATTEYIEDTGESGVKIPDTSKSEPDVFRDAVLGDYGAVYVDGLITPLYGDERQYDTSNDRYIDAENAAPVYRLPSGALYIPDHDYQGFDATLTADELKIKTVDGTVKIYKRVDYKECFTWDWKCTDGFSIWSTYPGGDLVTQTCIPNGVAFVIWQSE